MLETLILCMALDYLTGMMAAGIFHKSKKSAQIAGTDFICNAVMAAYLVNELLSITENLGLMGVPVPKVLTSAIDLLRQKSEAQETNKMQRAKGELVEAGEKEQKHQEREYQKREEKEL